MPKPEMPPESSIPLRVMVCLMWIVAISASFFFGESPIPATSLTAMQGAALVASIWLCIGGGIYSYHYREHPPPPVKLLIRLGVGLMILNLVRELFEANMGAMQFQFVQPLMHALVASSVLTSFEMRTRHDIIQSATFGLLLICVAAISGKSLLFGGIVFLYICFGTALLIYSCRSQTRTQTGDAAAKQPMVKLLTRRNLPIASALLFITVPIASAAAFCVMPRMDDEADSFAAQMRASLTASIASLRTGNKHDTPPAQPQFAPGPNKLKVARMREEVRHKESDKKSSSKKPPEEMLAVPPLKPPPSGTGIGAKPQPKNQTKPKTTAPMVARENPKLPPKASPSAQKSAEGKSKSGPAKKPGSETKQGQSGKTKLDESKVKTDVPMTNPEDPVFTLASNRSVYTRVMAMDEFDGHTWQRSDNVQKWEIEPSPRGVQFGTVLPMMITFDVPIMELAQAYTIETDLGNYVPIAGIPQAMSLVQPVTVDIYANVKAGYPLTKGTTYSVTAQLPVYALDSLRKLPPSEGGDPLNADQYLQIPENQSEELYALTSKVTGDGGNRFVRAERILNHLRKNYAYNSVPLVGSDPTKNIVDVFLFEEKKGDCKAYASAFVMMCRAAEIPARFTVGYLPGEFDNLTGVQHVKRKHGHAWAEAFIPPNGWVPFDATPTGTLPARPEEQYYNYERLTKEAQKYGEKVNSTGAVVLKNTLVVLHYLMLIAATALGAVALYFGFRAARGLLKQIAARMSTRHPASVVKNRVIKRLRKRGLIDSPTDTGAELIEKLRASLIQQKRSEDLADQFAQFIDVYNAAYFGREDRLSDLKGLESTITKLSR